MIVALTGSRNFTAEEVVYKALQKLKTEHADTLILSFGDAKEGLDEMVYRWARAHLRREAWIRHICHWPPPGSLKWEQWAAAHERNERVVRRAEMVLGFYGPQGVTSGTRDALDQAIKLGIPTHVYNQFSGRWS